METKHILSADILDILFDGRNKNYGAYDLRKTYNRRIRYAIGAMCLLCVSVVGGSLLANAKKHTDRIEVIRDVVLDNYKMPDEVVPPKPIEPPPQEPVAQVNDTPPVIVQDDQVKDEIKPVEELDNVHLGIANVEGKADDGIIAPPVEVTNTGIAAAPVKEKSYDDIFADVQIQASFPGGVAEWTKYLERHLNSELPSDNGAPAGQYAVIVSFIVDKTGHISDVRAENDPGFGTAAEAVRVIKNGPNWVAAEQNGHKVIYRQKQKVIFRVNE